MISMSSVAPALSFNILFLNAVIFIFKLTEKDLSNHTNFHWKIKEKNLGENPGKSNLYIIKQGLWLMLEEIVKVWCNMQMFFAMNIKIIVNFTR
jgi:hypothetical protein